MQLVSLEEMNKNTQDVLITLVNSSNWRSNSKLAGDFRVLKNLQFAFVALIKRGAMVVWKTRGRLVLTYSVRSPV